jgi:hypothetical protein
VRGGHRGVVSRDVAEPKPMGEAGASRGRHRVSREWWADLWARRTRIVELAQIVSNSISP